MKKILATSMAALLIAGLSAGTASAKHRRHHAKPGYSGMTTGSAPTGGYRGGNAALSGNNGNSGSGSNALGGNIQGGNIGAGK